MTETNERLDNMVLEGGESAARILGHKIKVWQTSAVVDQLAYGKCERCRNTFYVGDAGTIKIRPRGGGPLEPAGKCAEVYHPSFYESEYASGGRHYQWRNIYQLAFSLLGLEIDKILDDRYDQYVSEAMSNHAHDCYEFEAGEARRYDDEWDDTFELEDEKGAFMKSEAAYADWYNGHFFSAVWETVDKAISNSGLAVRLTEKKHKRRYNGVTVTWKSYDLKPLGQESWRTVARYAFEHSSMCHYDTSLTSYMRNEGFTTYKQVVAHALEEEFRESMVVVNRWLNDNLEYRLNHMSGPNCG